VFFDLQAEVGGNPLGLDGGDVGADHLDVGVVVGEIYCPEACAGSK